MFLFSMFDDFSCTNEDKKGLKDEFWIEIRIMVIPEQLNSIYSIIK